MHEHGGRSDHQLSDPSTHPPSDRSTVVAVDFYSCCRPILHSSFAEDYLFSVVTTVLRYVSSGNASVLSSQSSSSSSSSSSSNVSTAESNNDDPSIYTSHSSAVSWHSCLEYLLVTTSNSGIYAGIGLEEIHCMIATVRSIALWTRARTSTTTEGKDMKDGEKGGMDSGSGVSDLAAIEVIQQLKQLSDKLDSSHSALERIERVEVAKGKGGRGRKAIPKPVPKYGSGMDRVRALGISIRVWVLLAQWALPMSVRRDDKTASDGGLSSPFRFTIHLPI